MKSIALFATILFATGLNVAGGESPLTIVELPRPNSGTFSFQQAEARKSEILSNTPTPRLEKWRNPYMGFCIHIAKDDMITVYGHWLKALPEYRSPRTNQSVGDIQKLAQAIPLEGNPAGILITSDATLKNSKAIQDILKALLVPSVQLFYAHGSEPDGPANRSQPVRSETNQTPPAAGSGR